MKYGPLKYAPNPIQRKMVSSPRLIGLALTGSIGIFVIAPMFALASLFGDMDWRLAIGLVVIVIFGGWPVVTMTTKVRTLSRTELEESTVAYYPWFGGAVLSPSDTPEDSPSDQ